MEGRCFDCGARITGRNRSGLCPVCWPHWCAGCRVRLPEGRRTVFCIDCTRAQHERKFTHPGRRCTRCRVLLPAGRRNDYCRTCRCENAAKARAAKAAAGARPCRACGTPIAGTRSSNYCPPCQRRLREAASRQPGRKCCLCQAVRPNLGQAYCRACHALIAARWRARHAGEVEGGVG